MATARRVFWETVIFLSFLLVLGGVVLWSSKRVESRSTRLEKQHAQALEASVAEHQQEIDALRKAADERALRQAEGEAQAVFEAVAAVSATAIEARWGNYLARATEDLARLRRVAFVYILTPTGTALGGKGDASDGTDGGFSERSAWALTAESLQQRPGISDGILELAAPVTADGRTVAYVWLGYDIQAAAANPSPRP